MKKNLVLFILYIAFQTIAIYGAMQDFPDYICISLFTVSVIIGFVIFVRIIGYIDELKIEHQIQTNENN